MSQSSDSGKTWPLAEGGIGLLCAVALAGWLARYVKEVDAGESTIRYWQEIYDDQNQLVEVHEKFPVDKGH